MSDLCRKLLFVNTQQIIALDILYYIVVLCIPYLLICKCAQFIL